MIKAVTVISLELSSYQRYFLSSCAFAMEPRSLPDIFVHNTKQQRRECNSNETFPNYCSISVINMYGWLLCPQMPWEKAGMQKSEVFIPELSEGVCQHNQPCPEQPDCTETLGDKGSAGTASAKDKRKSLNLTEGQSPLELTRKETYP